MMARDTTPEAEAVLISILRRQTPDERVQGMLDMCEVAREISRSGIKARHPDYSDAEVEHALHRLLVGDALADEVWPEHRHLIP